MSQDLERLLGYAEVCIVLRMLQYTRTRTNTYNVCSTLTTGAHRFSLGGSDAQAADAALAEPEPAAGPVAPAARAFRYRPSRASAITLLFRTIPLIVSGRHTPHKWASIRMLDHCHPQFDIKSNYEFSIIKTRYDTGNFTRMLFLVPTDESIASAACEARAARSAGLWVPAIRCSCGRACAVRRRERAASSAAS